MNIRYLLLEKANQFSSKPALIYSDQVITFYHLRQKVFQLANALKKMGVKKQDKIAIFLPNCPEYVYSYLAAFCLGATAVPLDFMLKKDELISCLGHAEANVFITLPKADIPLAEIQKSLPALQHMLICGVPQEVSTPEFLNWQDLVSNQSDDFPEIPINDKDLSLIMYTSGTTGRPKGIMLNYKHLEGSPRAMEYFVDLTERDVKLCAIPLSHIGGFIYIQNCIVYGITVVLMERFNPLEFLKAIEKYKITCFHIVPAMYTAILTLKGIENFNLASLRWVVVFGAPSSPEILKRFHQYCPNAQLLNGWGMTETCPPNTVTPLSRDRSRPVPTGNIASVGKLAPHCEIKIFDEAGKEVSAGGIGEIVIRGWIVMDGYYKDPEATVQTIRNGWLYTGDLGRFDKEGYLYIVGRKKEMIKVGGQIVYAPEVEASLYKHEAVSEVAVVGMSDKLRGEVVKAFVVLKQGATTSAEDLRYFAREHLANFKVPQSIEFKDSLPKNRTGKIDKELLKSEGSLVKSES